MTELRLKHQIETYFSEVEIVYLHGIFFVCPSPLSRNSHKLEFDARHDAVESLGPTTPESPQLKNVITINVNIRKSEATGIC